MLNEKQKKDRMLGIGGSDMAIILGLSTYKTPYQLYLEKIGEAVPSSETESQEWGNRLEGAIRKKFAEKHNVLVLAPHQDFHDCPPSPLLKCNLHTMVHPFLDFMRANIDGYIPDWKAGLEIKTSSAFMASEWGEDGTDVIPMAYLVQVAYYCAVLNVDTWYIAALIGGNDYREFKYTRDNALENKIIDVAQEFWNCVQNKTPPPPINQADLRLMFPMHEPEKISTINNDVNQQLILLHETRNKIKELTEIKEKQTFNIMQYMESTECLVDNSGKPLATWKTNKAGNRTFLLKGAL